MSLVTHFCQFASEAAARAALTVYTVNGAWRADIVDVGIPVQSPAGSGTLKSGYFVNVALPALDMSLPGLTGAGYRDHVTKAWVTVYGTQPAGAPQQEFMA